MALGEVVARDDGHPLLGDPLAVAAVLLVERVDVERLAGLDAEDVLGERPLLGDDVLEAVAEHLGVEQVADPDAPPAGLVLVGRADAPAGRAGVEVALALGLLLDAVEHAVVGQDDVGALGDAHVGVEPALAKGVEFVEQRPGVDDAPVPEDAGLPADRPAGDERQLELVAVDHHSVARVVPALVPGDDVRVVGVQVDDAPLALVAELRADDGDGHAGCGFFASR